MIGLDTNILLRALTGDDAVQSPLAARVLGELTPDEPGYINLIVLAETVWSLGRRYKADRAAIVDAVESLLESQSLVLAERAAVIESLELARSGRLDFADAFIATLNRHAGCRATVTFDTKAGETGLFQSAS